jgi:hypothetical protein
MSTPHISLSHHATARAQQRGLPPLIMDWLDAYGARTSGGRGAEIVHFDKASRQRLRRDVGAQVVDRLRPLLDAYLVMSADGTVITVGWRLKRVLQH